MQTNTLPHPDELMRLMEAKLWPSSHEQAIQQNLSRRISASDVARMISGESQIFLHPNPRTTLADDYRASEQKLEGAGFFNAYREMLKQIDPDRALFIADFGPGSDAPIALDFRENQDDPPVIALQWNDHPGTNEKSRWVQLAPSFSEFVKQLNLWSLPKFKR